MEASGSASPQRFAAATRPRRVQPALRPGRREPDSRIGDRAGRDPVLHGGRTGPSSLRQLHRHPHLLRSHGRGSDAAAARSEGAPGRVACWSPARGCSCSSARCRHWSNASRVETAPVLVFIYGFLGPFGVFLAVYRLWPVGSALRLSRLIVALGMLQLVVVVFLDIPRLLASGNPDEISGTFGENAYQLVFFLLVFGALLAGIFTFEKKRPVARLVPALFVLCLGTIFLAQYRALLLTTFFTIILIAVFLGSARLRGVAIGGVTAFAFLVTLNYVADTLPGPEAGRDHRRIDWRSHSDRVDARRRPGPHRRAVQRRPDVPDDRNRSGHLCQPGVPDLHSGREHVAVERRRFLRDPFHGRQAVYNGRIGPVHRTPGARGRGLSGFARSRDAVLRLHLDPCGGGGARAPGDRDHVPDGAALRCANSAHGPKATDRDDPLPALSLACMAAFFVLLQMAILQSWLEVTRITFPAWILLAVVTKEYHCRYRAKLGQGTP